jgi:hypothetical protein
LGICEHLLPSGWSLSRPAKSAHAIAGAVSVAPSSAAQPTGRTVLFSNLFYNHPGQLVVHGTFILPSAVAEIFICMLEVSAKSMAIDFYDA